MMTRLLSFAAVLMATLLVAVGCATAQPSSAEGQTEATEAAATPISPRIYVCNQGSATVTVIDATTREVIETVDLQALGFSANAKPHHAVAEPDGSFWYLSLIAENTILKLTPENEIVEIGRAHV